MKKTFQKTLIAASVGVVMLSAAGTASANSLLFPYFTTVAGAQSVLTLTSTSTAAADSQNNIHYVYNYGSGCVHHDQMGRMTQNDVLSHSIASPTTAGGFGKVTSTDTSTPVYFPANDTGFLVVSSKTTEGDDLRGSMAIVDTNSGLVVSYAPINNGLDTSTATVNEGNFSTITDLKFALNFMPSGYVTTSWFTSVVGNMWPAISAGANYGGVVTFTNNGNVFNNEEVPISGTTTKAITCSGSITPAMLGSTTQLLAVGTNGGLVKVTGTTTAGTNATGAVLMKMQTVLPAVGAPFAGKQFMHREIASPTSW